MKTVLLDTQANTVSVIDIEDKLEAFYEKLHCDTIDITERFIDGKAFDIMCDDDGLLVINPCISAVDSFYETKLVGSLMFFHTGEEGELVGLSDEDVELVKSHIKKLRTRQRPEGSFILVGCEDWHPENSVDTGSEGSGL